MKGIIFTEFLGMIEVRHSLDFVDELLDSAHLASNGSYTAVGTYPHEELLELLSLYAARTGTPIADTLRTFGTYLFGRFHAAYPEFFTAGSGALEFLQSVDQYIHIEVLKLYPHAELPSFEYETLAPGRLRIVYRSTRPLAPLAEGLIRGCIEHFGEDIDVVIEDLSGGAGTAAAFVLTAARAHA